MVSADMSETCDASLFFVSFFFSEPECILSWVRVIYGLRYAVYFGLGVLSFCLRCSLVIRQDAVYFLGAVFSFSGCRYSLAPDLFSVGLDASLFVGTLLSSEHCVFDLDANEYLALHPYSLGARVWSALVSCLLLVWPLSGVIWWSFQAD